MPRLQPNEFSFGAATLTETTVPCNLVWRLAWPDCVVTMAEVQQKIEDMETRLNELKDELDAARLPPDKKLGQKAVAKKQAAKVRLAAEEKELTKALALARGEHDSKRLGDLLRKSVASGDREGVERFCAHGVQVVNSQNFEGTHALIKAAIYDRAELTQALVEAGARLELPDDRGRTALCAVPSSMPPIKDCTPPLSGTCHNPSLFPQDARGGQRVCRHGSGVARRWCEPEQRGSSRMECLHACRGLWPS